MVLAPVMVNIRMRGIKIHPHLDDILIWADSKEVLIAHMNTVIEVLMQAGFIINLKKSKLSPSRQLEFLIVVFSMHEDRMYLLVKKIHNLARIIDLFRVGVYVKARLWLCLLGQSQTNTVVPERGMECHQVAGYARFGSKTGVGDICSGG
jgi:hypothetical protein